MNKKILLPVALISLFFVNPSLLAAQGGNLRFEAIGEVFGRPVSSSEFNYYLKTASIFTRFGKDGERKEEEVRNEAWQNLIFRQEATRLNISVTKQELKEEIQRLLSEKEIEYGSADYPVWISSQLGEDVDIFERRIEDLLIINKFMNEKTNPEVTATDEEAKEKFLNQYNSFESEYIKFDNEGDAKAFLEKVKADPKLWKDTYDQKRELGQKGSSWINIMSLEALIDLWKIPRDDAYRILAHQPGEFIAAKFFYGDAVFRLLSKRDADLEKFTDKKKESLKDAIIRSRKHKIVKEYFEELLGRANYRDFVAEKMKEEKTEALKKKSQVVLKTSQGGIEIKLFPDKAPYAVENFIGLIEKGYYDGIIFHRVIKDFMIQGGDPTGTGTGGESLWGKDTFIDEFSEGLQFDRKGLLAMANSGPNTNKSQFFITVKPAPHLNNRHTIFGEVVSGYDVVEKINSVETDSGDKPKDEQKIIKAYIKDPEKKEDKDGQGS